MEIQAEMEIKEAATPEELRLREWNTRLRAAGIQPASGPWPYQPFDLIKPRFYRVRRLFWPLRGFIRRFL